MQITNSTKLTIPIYNKFFKGSMFFAAAIMLALSAFLFFISITNESGQKFKDFWLPATVIATLTFICIWSAYASLRNKIVVDNGQIAWGYFTRHKVYIDDIIGITEMRSVTTLQGEQFVILRFSDRKDETHAITVNSKQGKEFLDSMIETFGNPD
jgi:hypothetical protein